MNIAESQRGKPEAAKNLFFLFYCEVYSSIHYPCSLIYSSIAFVGLLCSLSQLAVDRKTIIHTYIHTDGQFTVTIINLCVFWTDGGNWSTKRKPSQEEQCRLENKTLFQYCPALIKHSAGCRSFSGTFLLVSVFLSTPA